MGELMKRRKTAVAQASEEFVAVQTMGGGMHVRWDETAQTTPHRQIVYFAEFLATAGIFESWVQSCTLLYSSPNAPGVRDVLGTLMLSILAGSKRYAHVAGIRGDAVAAQALGLNKIVKLHPRQARLHGFVVLGEFKKDRDQDRRLLAPQEGFEIAGGRAGHRFLFNPTGCPG